LLTATATLLAAAATLLAATTLLITAAALTFSILKHFLSSLGSNDCDRGPVLFRP
jgi:hypothetical protein